METQIHNRVGMDPPLDMGEAPMFFPNETRGQAQALKAR
jgi:hypothetical protein